MSTATIKKLGFIAKLAYAVTAAQALEASGIDPAAADLSAAIADALKAKGLADPDLIAKGASYDKLVAQAAKADIDLVAMLAKEDGLGDAIDTRARALLKSSLGDNAPDPEGKEKSEKNPGTRVENPKDPAAAYAQALEDGDEEGASAIFAANPNMNLARLKVILPGD